MIHLSRGRHQSDSLLGPRRKKKKKKKKKKIPLHSFL